MGNSYFSFKQFTVNQENCAMKVTTDACLFGAWANSKIESAETLLDIGSGTGLLSLMLSQNRSIKIDAIEIESSCYGQLCQNIQDSPYVSSINAIYGDIKDWETDTRYQVVISNPPFYEKQLRSDQAGVNLARHSDGLTLESLFSHAKRLMSSDGFFYVLMPFYRKAECMDMASRFQLFPFSIADVKQSPFHDAFRVMIQFSTHPGNNETETIIIKKNASEYSDAFKLLLEQYYLNL
jgi:tRNA1Val (adenine37-N6)-methyltransferase